MAQAIANSQLVRGATTLAVASRYLGARRLPVAHVFGHARRHERASTRSYIGRNEQADEQQPAEESWTAEQKYEYRGGRDPVTGRANTQM